MKKRIRITIMLGILSISCIAICACNHSQKNQEEITTQEKDAKTTERYVDETTTEEEISQDALDEAIKQLEELNDILKD